MLERLSMDNFILFAQAQQNPPDEALATAVGIVGLACGGIVGLLVYFLPTFIALMRGHHNTFAIVALNILAGWTFVGWVAALVWSLTAIQRQVGSESDASGPGEPPTVSRVHGERGRGADNKTLWIVLGVIGCVALVIFCIPCGIGLLVPAVQRVREAAERTKHLNDLSEVGKAIHLCYDANKRMPATVEDIQPFLSPSTLQLVRNGEIQVVWNAVSFREEDRGTSNVIIGWNSKPADNGQRPVLFMDASVRALSEDEFRNTPKVRIAEKELDLKK
jgi:Superinfection immunity protein